VIKAGMRGLAGNGGSMAFGFQVLIHEVNKRFTKITMYRF
jgi:hypothetical protein